MIEPASMDALERTIGRLLRLGVVLSSTALAAGVLIALVAGPTHPATVLLGLGIALLIGTPIARVVASVVSYARRRDWVFVALTLIVLAELAASVVAALRGRS